MRPLKNICEIAIIGGGLAGLSAARHAARLGRLVTLFEGSGLYGGLVATVGEVDGLPFPGKLSGQDLAIHQMEEARKAGVQFVENGVVKLDLADRITLTDESGSAYHPEGVVIATGTALRRLDVPGESEFVGRGVSHCATCDGGFFRGQDVVVVGGGDAAVQEALTLIKTSRRVIMVCRSPLRARRDYVEKIASKDNVTFVWDSEVSAILGEEGVSSVRVRNVKDGATADIACTGIFPFIGGAPNTAFVPASLLNASHHVRACGGVSTADPRVFAAGAVREGYGGYLVQAMAEGIEAAEAVARLPAH